MKIKMVSACFVNKKIQKVGTVLEVPDSLGRELIASRKAETHVEEPKKPEAPSEDTPKTKKGKGEK